MTLHSLRKFSPPLLLRNGHLQTLFGAYRSAPQLEDTIVLELSIHPHGKMLAYINHPKQPIQSTDKAPLQPKNHSSAILLVHGLGGCHGSPYLIRLADQLSRLGHLVVRVDLPGSGPSWKLSSLPAHAGCSDQLGMALNELSQQLKIERWSIAGFSLSGNIVLKMILDQSWTQPHPSFTSNANIRLNRVALVSPPIDLHLAAQSIERFSNQLYNRYFVWLLKRQTKQRATRWRNWEDRLAEQKEQRVAIRTIRQFDDFYTSRLAGFDNVDDYYSQASTINRVHELQHEIEILIDQHDPIVPASIIESANWPDTVQFTTTRYGGHLGYFQKGPHGCWMDEWVIQKLSQNPNA